MAGVKVKPQSQNYVVEATPVFTIDPTTGQYAPGGGGGTFTAAGTATAAAPSYAEGSTNPLSMDLTGALRVAGSFSASSVATATAAAPSYGEGTSQPFSQNLSGDLRVIAKQSGTYTVSGTVAATQSGTWNVATVTAVTSITNPVAATQSGAWNIGTLATITNPVAVTVADGADVTQGDKSDAAYDGLGGDMSLVSGIRTIANEMLSTDPAAVNMVASTPYYNAAVGTAKYLVTASPAVLTDYYITNPHATDVLSVLIYDASSTASVTVGTTTPKRQIALVGGQSANIGAIALNFAVGIVIAAIKDYSGTTAPTTSAIVSLGYRAP